MAKEPLTFSDKASALAERDRWIQELPPTKSAYQPSGKVPKIAWLILPTIGTAAGIFATILTGAIIAFVCGFLTAFALRLPFSILLFPLTALFTLFFLGSLPGIGGAVGVYMLSKAVKNRNPYFTGIIALIAGAIGAVGLWRYVIPTISLSVKHALPPLADGSFLQPGAGLQPALIVMAHRSLGAVVASRDDSDVIIYISAALAGVLAFLTGKSATRDSKFCEACGEYMKTAAMPLATFSMLQDFVQAVEQGQPPDGWMNALPTDKGESGKLTVFSCPRCEAGFLEVTATFSARYATAGKENKVEKLSKSWTASSKSADRQTIGSFTRRRSKSEQT